MTTQTKPNDSQQQASCHSWLTTYRAALRDDLSRYTRYERRWSWARLIAFVLAVAVAVLLRGNLLPAGLAATVGLAVFILTIWRHIRWQDRRVSAEHIGIVVEESLHASRRRDTPARTWARPEDPPDSEMSLPTVIAVGPTWPLSDQERDDLDLYGPPVGLFGLLNRTSTDPGARRLRDILDHPCLRPADIGQRQRAVQWLAERNEFRLRMMAALVPLRRHGGRLDRLVRLLHQRQYPGPSMALKVIRVWSVLSGLLFLLSLVYISAGKPGWGRALVGLLLVNNILLLGLGATLKRLNAAVSPWPRLSSTLRCFLAVARPASDGLPDEGHLNRLRQQFQAVTDEADIPSLCVWLEWAGLHGIVRSLLNMIVLLDVHITEAVLTRVASGRDVLLRGLSSMAELEALCSLACFSAEQPVACYPEPVATTGLVIEDGRHPLILEPDATPNRAELTCEKRTWVITGPNAAGKSTFLRMVGVNVLLAQIGAAVAARQMTWSPVRLLTDVRIRDDLARHESYFLTEVRRLRRLVLDSQDSTPVLGLIDEPFRGTNSQERTAAGVALLEHLMASRNLFLVATHEEVLAQVAATAASGENYHFQEHLHEGGVRFDYRLRAGPATTRTAIRILEQEGYPKSLLERARRLTTDQEQPPKPD